MLLALSMVPGCRKPGPSGDDGSSGPTSGELPPLELRDDTRDLLLTWVDEKGDFSVAQSVADVPAERREKVRVVIAKREEGTRELVYVADLRQKRPDGTYTVATMTRAQWDEVGASLRKSRLEALAPSAAGSQVPPAPSAARAGDVVVVIYGSASCSACREAARFLKERGVKVVEKRIDENEVARAEMAEKLRRANLPDRGAIPVLDVGGRMLVGFDPVVLDAAIRARATTQTL
jgi:glutaredoxin